MHDDRCGSKSPHRHPACRDCSSAATPASGYLSTSFTGTPCGVCGTTCASGRSFAALGSSGNSSTLSSASGRIGTECGGGSCVVTVCAQSRGCTQQDSVIHQSRAGSHRARQLQHSKVQSLAVPAHRPRRSGFHIWMLLAGRCLAPVHDSLDSCWPGHIRCCLPLRADFPNLLSVSGFVIRDSDAISLA